RHSQLISIANSLLLRQYDEDEDKEDDTYNADKLKAFFEEINLKFCKPEPLPQDELDSIWKSCVEFVSTHKNFVIKNRNQSSQVHDENRKTPSDLIEQ